jgi:Protein of unknown function (DUF2628)
VDAVPWCDRPAELTEGRSLLLQASSRERESASDLEALRSRLRAFARLRQSAEASGEGSSPGLRVEHDAAEPAPLPLDLTKTFVGPNGTYYDETWRLMEWRGAQRSWNWAAVLSLGGWLAYRRLYDHAALHAVWLILLILVALSGTPIRLLLMIQVIVAVLLGVYGNALYRRRFRQAAEAAGRHDGDYTAQLAVLVAAGGTDHRAVAAMVVAIVAASIALVAFRQSMEAIRLTW